MSLRSSGLVGTEGTLWSFPSPVLSCIPGNENFSHEMRFLSNINHSLARLLVAVNAAAANYIPMPVIYG